MKLRALYGIYMLALPLAMAALGACSIARRLPKEQALLGSQRIAITGKGLAREDLQPYLRQRPNARIAWLRFHLWLYNFAKPDKNRWIDRKLRLFGEPPSIYDSVMAMADAQRLRDYIAFRGFYDNEVEVEVTMRRRSIGVLYRVALGEPYVVRSAAFSILDSLLEPDLVEGGEPLVKAGMRFDGEVLDAETNRIAQRMRNAGYYMFNKNYVSFTADTSNGCKEADVVTLVQQELADNYTSRREPHRCFEIGRVSINANYDPAGASRDSAYYSGWDTLEQYGFRMAYKGKPMLKPAVAAIYNKIESGAQYSEKVVTATYDNFARLRLFQSINIRFAPRARDSAGSDTLGNVLDASIMLSPQTLMNYRISGDVSLSGKGLWGVSAKIGYQHKNLLRGAEILDINAGGVFQKIQWRTDAEPQNSVEMSLDAAINVPQFSMPINLGLYRNLVSPRTMAAASLNYQQRPDYVRWLSSASFGYSWQNLANMTYIFTPLEVNLINVRKTGEVAFFDSFADNPYLMSAYQNTLLLGLTFAGIYNTQRSAKSDYSYVRLDVESKGNLLYGIYKAAGGYQAGSGSDRYYNVFDTRFAQFVRFNLTYSVHRQLSDGTAFAGRAMMGLGVAYGNSLTMPFDKMYSAGGAYSMRGWQIRGLGPGAYDGGEEGYIINRIANMRIEMNAEYRFQLLGMLEGAAFIDAGNVWSTDTADRRPGAGFSLGSLPRTIALNWGLGLRLLVSMLVLRLDYGIQLHAPALGGRYLVGIREWGERSAVIFGLGYPF